MVEDSQLWAQPRGDTGTNHMGHVDKRAHSTREASWRVDLSSVCDESLTSRVLPYVSSTALRVSSLALTACPQGPSAARCESVCVLRRRRSLRKAARPRCRGTIENMSSMLACDIHDTPSEAEGSVCTMQPRVWVAWARCGPSRVETGLVACMGNAESLVA
jgi:hypothetical protein